MGVYPDALVMIVNAPEKNLQDWIATLTIRSVRSNTFQQAEITQEQDRHRREVMVYWNQYLTTLKQTTHPHEGLAWDHPGFLPPDRPDPGHLNKSDE